MLTTFFSQEPIQYVEFAIYSLIILVAFVGLIKCIFPLYICASTLFNAEYKLEKNISISEKPIWKNARFMGRSLRHEWQLFLNNAIEMESIGKPFELNTFINEDVIIDQKSHERLADLIPNLLTSLGILGTFIGLTQGLSTVDFSSAEGTMQTIPQLLNGMRFAFTTSVVGISGSLLFNILYRIAIGRATKAISSFENSFYKLVMPRPFTSDVQLLSAKQDEETRLLQAIENTTNHLSTTIELALGRAMFPLTQSLETFINGVTKTQIEGVNNIVNHFIKQMNHAIQTEFSNVNDRTQWISSMQMQQQKQLENSLSLFNDMTENTKKTLDATSNIAKQLSNLSKILDEQKQKDWHLFQQDIEVTNLLHSQLAQLQASISAWEETTKKLTEQANTPL